MGLLVAITAASVGIIYGYDLSNIAGALLFITNEFGLTTHQQELVTTAVVIGEIAGAIGGGMLANAIGRKKSMVLVGATYAAFALLSALSVSVPMLLVSRLLLGLTIGVSVVVVPVFVAESAPAKSRGALLAQGPCCAIQFFRRARFDDNKFYPARLRSALRVWQCERSYGIVRIDEHRHSLDSRHDFGEQQHVFANQLGTESYHAGDVTTRACEADREPVLDRIIAVHDDDWNLVRGLLRKDSDESKRGRDDINFACDEVGSLLGKSLLRSIGIAILDDEVAALDVPSLAKAVTECIEQTRRDR